MFDFIGLLSPNHGAGGEYRDDLSAAKSVGDSASIEQTRKEKLRQALRSISKVAFSQIGLGK